MWQFIVLFVLLAFSAFFSASETALMSISKIRVRHMVEEEVGKAKLVQRLIESPNKLLGAILVGNNVVNIGASALATSLAIQYFGVAGVPLATAVMTILVLIFGEITPKSLAAQFSEKTSLSVIRPIALIVIILTPITNILMFFTNFIIKLLGGNSKQFVPFITQEELMTIVNVSHEEGVLEGEEREMIHNVFEFGDTHTKDIMTIRADMFAVDMEITYDELMNLYKEEQFSRIPVYGESYDHIEGVLYVKDLLFFEGEKLDFKITDFIRPAYYTYEFKKTADLFKEMRDNRIGMSIVLDEYGGTAGLVTIEDLVEEIVGDIEDEYDDEENDIEVVKEDEYIVDGSVRLEIINEMIGINLESEDFDSIGGFVIGLIGRLPEIGEVVDFDTIKFIIESIDKNRIEKIRIIT